MTIVYGQLCRKKANGQKQPANSQIVDSPWSAQGGQRPAYSHSGGASLHAVAFSMMMLFSGQGNLGKLTHDQGVKSGQPYLGICNDRMAKGPPH